MAEDGTAPDGVRQDGAGRDEASSGGLSYEAARDELVEVVRALEGGGTSLAESLALWERGEELARICQDALEGVRSRLDAVIGAEDPADDPADDG